MKRWLKMILRSILLGVAGFTGLLFFGQHKLIWLPRPYGPTYKLALPKTAAELRYTTSQGKQCAFYLPPTSASSSGPERVWVLFGGNGSLALDWADFVARDPDRRDGFLLVDYPGYGLCEGTAEPSNIEESADKALGVLAEHLKITPGELESKLNVLAHSIGTGAALQFAVHHPVRRVVLLSPFTSLRDMARRTVGWPLCWLLLHNFDNRARLKELAARPSPPRVTIFHGTADEVIPFKMGQTLGTMFPQITTFHAVPDATHDSIVDDAAPEIFSTMNQP
jgi:pimeloyl-ACP methyl ester carboxylesterase